MSKVLVDRELLERAVMTLEHEAVRCHIDRVGALTDAYCALRCAIAQPAEAEGAKPDAFEVARHSRRLVEQLREQLAAVTAERDRLAGELSESRVDASYYAARNEQLRAEADLLRKDAERWRYVRLQGDDTHWLNLLRVDLEDFGGNVDAAVDALIDGDSTAMAAKESTHEE